MDKNSIGNKEDCFTSTALSQRADKYVLAPLLSEYEVHIAALQQQIQVYKVEHESLRKELAEVIAENRQLSERLKNVLGKKLSEDAVLHPYQKKESDMVRNLQQQLSLITQEKESAIELWHLALREVDNVDKHENRHVDKSNRRVDNMKKDFTEAISLLEAKLNSTKSILAKERVERDNIEKKYHRIIEENETLAGSLKNRQEELEAALEGQCSFARKLQEVEKKVVELEKQVETFKETEHELESALSQCHKHIEDLVRRNVDAQEKVSESLQLVESALAEKEAAVIAESKLREENIHLQQMMANVIEEAGIKVKEEVENVKRQYNGKLKTLLLDMKKLEDECHEKEKKLRKEIEERNILEGQLELIQKETAGAMNLMEKRLNMVHDELSDVRQSNLQLSMEKESLHSEIERLQSSHAVELRRLGQEYQAMEQRVLVMQTQLEAARCEKEIHIEKLMHQIRLLEQQADKKFLISRKELQEWQQKELHQQEYEDLLSQLQKIQKQSVATACELEHHLGKQHSMKIKYQKAMKMLTQKMEKRINELRHESNTLKKENKCLEEKLSNIQDALAAQRQLSKDDNK